MFSASAGMNNNKKTRNNVEIELTKKLLEKYDFSSILILSEVGPNERIALQLANQRQIPVCLVQHGINYDTNESYDMNVAKGALPINSDHFLCWGKIGKEFSRSMGINSEKVHAIGSPYSSGLCFILRLMIDSIHLMVCSLHNVVCGR